MRKLWGVIIVLILLNIIFTTLIVCEVFASSIGYCTVAKCHVHNRYKCEVITAYDETYWSVDPLPKPIAQYHTFGQDYYELEEYK